MESVDIMLAGRVLPGTDPNQAAADFARISGLDVQVVLAAISFFILPERMKLQGREHAPGPSAARHVLL